MADQSVIEHTALAVVKQTLPSTTSFVFGGQGKRQTVKLSAPGLHAIAELIARIRAR